MGRSARRGVTYLTCSSLSARDVVGLRACCFPHCSLLSRVPSLGPLLALPLSRCGPCQFLLPILDELAARYEGRLRILKVDTESEPELASALAIRGLPTLCFVRDGALKYRMEGALAADELASIIDQILLDVPATEA